MKHVTAVIGGHYGDEGKGKVVDFLAPEFDLVMRFNGGPNAGHTVVADGKTYKLHHIPSGILHPNTINLIGPGCVINPDKFIEEVTILTAAGVDLSNLHISDRAHLILPRHIRQDEEYDKERNFGTTKQGIWPVYSDKVARNGVRVGDIYGPAAPRWASSEWMMSLSPFICDALDVIRKVDSILLEGSLGVMRDIDWGIYPYVTSSSCLPAVPGVPAPTRIIGVFKAYCTSIGAGPFPTEIEGSLADRLREKGGEYGTTTGRPRRIGWFDAVAAKYAAEVAGFTELAITKLDVLEGFDEVKICVGYEAGGKMTTKMLPTEGLLHARPIYEDWPGWNWKLYSPNAHYFLRRIAELIGVRVSTVGFGPERGAVYTLTPWTQEGFKWAYEQPI